MILSRGSIQIVSEAFSSATVVVWMVVVLVVVDVTCPIKRNGTCSWFIGIRVPEIGGSPRMFWSVKIAILLMEPRNV